MTNKKKQAIKRNEEAKMWFINNKIGSILFLRQTFCLFLLWSLFLFSFSVNLEASPRYDGKLRIAVLDLEAQGIPELEAQTGSVTPVGPIKINRVLKETGFHQEKTTSSEWARKAGKLLGVHQVMKGSLGKIGNSYIINAQLFDVETGSIHKNITRVYRGEADGLIMEIEKLAWDVAGVVPKSGKVTNMSRSVIPTPAARSIQASRSHVVPQNRQINKPQIQTKSLSNKLLSGFGGNSGILLGGSILSYLVVKGLIAVVSNYDNRKASKPEIGLPPDFPEVPPPPGI